MSMQTSSAGGLRVAAAADAPWMRLLGMAALQVLHNNGAHSQVKRTEQTTAVCSADGSVSA